jgi:hypothetical protein
VVITPGAGSAQVSAPAARGDSPRRPPSIIGRAPPVSRG